MSSLKILLAPIGMPKEYKDVIYIFNGEEIKSNTPLSTLIQKLKPNSCYIFVSETIGIKDELYNNENCKNLYKNIHKEAINLTKENLKLENCNIIVLPSAGSYKPNKNSNIIFSFKGKFTDYYYALIYKLITEIFKADKLKSVDTLEIYIDITHGINFMPAFVYKAVREVAEILAMFLNKVKLYVYNSDPYIQNLKNQKLNINLIEEIEIKGKPYDRKLERDRSYFLFKYYDKSKQKLLVENIASKYPENISTFIGAIYNGLPLAIYTYFPDSNILKSILDYAFETLNEKIGCYKENNTLIIEKEIYLHKTFKSIAFVYLIAEMFKVKDILDKSKDEVCLEELKIFRDFYKRFDKKIFSIIDNELWNLKKNFKDKISNNWNLANYIIEGNCKYLDDNPKERNFLAHAGFEYNSIEIRKCENSDDIKIRYRKIEDINYYKECEEYFKTKGLTKINTHRKAIENYIKSGLLPE